MALTVEQLGRTNVAGNRLSVALKITPDGDNYPSGGESLVLTDYVANIDTVHCETSTTGIVASYDRANSKLMLWQTDASGSDSPLAQVVTGDMSSAIIYVTVTGGRA